MNNAAMVIDRVNKRQLSSEISALRKRTASLSSDHGMVIASKYVREFVLSDLTIGMAIPATGSRMMNRPHFITLMLASTDCDRGTSLAPSSSPDGRWSGHRTGMDTIAAPQTWREMQE